MKALETPEEKRARRLAKKEAKERKKREKMGWSEEYMGYTNADNPFGDNNLLGTFKWQKVFHLTYSYCYFIVMSFLFFHYNYSYNFVIVSCRNLKSV